ncbi:MAG: ATP synthase F1 subunit gamma [Candidatus Xenobiia bacterium LiM19]
MANVRDIKNRIKSIENIQQITKAMKMIASARIKKVERSLKSRKPYCERLFEIIDEVMSQLDEPGVHPLLEKRQENGDGALALLVITADKGLCGGYNMNIIRAAERFIRKSGKTVRLYVVGNKAFRYFSRKLYTIDKEYVVWDPNESLARDLAFYLAGEYINGRFDELWCVYTQCLSLLSQNVVEEPLLPLRRREIEIRDTTYVFEPSPAATLELLLPRYFKELIMRLLLDARTAELSARINAMANATENAESVVDELRLNYYRARQDAITTEILEVTSGAEKLNRK